MRIAAAQMAPVFLDREATLQKILSRCEEAATQGVRLLAFPETTLPGYPTWLARTDGARFDDPLQKTFYARYLDQAVELPGPVLDQLQQACADLDLHVVAGIAERGSRTGRGTLWCTALHVSPTGDWLAHRKLVPTYEERLVWGWGDGGGLRVRRVDGWNVGMLNCWENWMPAARLALYAQGEELHVSLWPGSPRLTRDIARFVALEGRVWVLAVSGVLREADLPDDVPAREPLLQSAAAGVLNSGGSRIVAPDGSDVAALDTPEEGLVVATIDRDRLRGERQNFDVAGHYSRPDVFRLHVDRRRQRPATFDDSHDDSPPKQ